jgi:competence protein ComEA
MLRTTIPSTLITVILLAWSNLSPAAENVPGTSTAAKSSSADGAPRKSAKLKLVDLNHASKAELKSLTGISDTMAAKIIAGRPYNSKAAIVTDGIVPAGIFFMIKDRIVVNPVAMAGSIGSEGK